ncbi:hypothetical protein Hanom_Chr12g01127221 [Helianthus anomalus]
MIAKLCCYNFHQNRTVNPHKLTLLFLSNGACFEVHTGRNIANVDSLNKWQY